MKRKAYLIAAIGLIATFGVIGGSIDIVDTAEAHSNWHKSNDSLAGRTFLIYGEWVEWNDDPASKPDPFSNCYFFQEDGTWNDPKFPDPNNPRDNPAGGIPGTYVQHTGGFLSRYTAFATGVDLIAPGVDLQLIQNGIVTPTWRKGKMRLSAYSTVLIGDFVLGVVLSRGHSVDTCPPED